MTTKCRQDVNFGLIFCVFCFSQLLSEEPQLYRPSGEQRRKSKVCRPARHYGQGMTSHLRFTWKWWAVSKVKFVEYHESLLSSSAQQIIQKQIWNSGANKQVCSKDWIVKQSTYLNPPFTDFTSLRWGSVTASQQEFSSPLRTVSLSWSPSPTLTEGWHGGL